MKHQSSVFAAALLVIVAGLGERAVADDRSAVDLLPASTLVYAELRKPHELIDLALNHPIRQKLDGFKEVQKAYEGKEYLQFKAAVSVVEAQLGKTWPKLLAGVAGEGVAIGFDAKTEGAAVILKAQDESTSAALVSNLVSLARQDANSKGNPDPVKQGEYRGVTAYQVDRARLAVSGPWLLVTNKPEFGQTLIDTILDKTQGTLATNEQFRAARDAAPSDAVAWGYLNIAALREAGAAKGLFKGQADNPAAELIVGGILSNLQKTPFVSASLLVSADSLRVEVNTPHDPAWIPEEREYFFGPEGKGAAPPLLVAKNTILSLSSYRNVSEMWLRAGDLFDDKVNDQLAQADSNLSTLFSGKDFGEDILGAVKPEVQLVVVRQEFKEGAPKPAIKLPAFALEFDLRDPETMRAELRRTFQSLIGFLNVVGAMQGQPQLELDIDKEGDAQLVTATYLPEKDAKPNLLKINFNFSPSVAFVGDRFIVSSTKQLAQELIGLSPTQAGAPSNTTAVADFRTLRDILADNRAQLVAQNMLEDGNTKEEAEKEIGTLLELMGLVADVSLRFSTNDKTMQVALEAKLNSDAK